MLRWSISCCALSLLAGCLGLPPTQEVSPIDHAVTAWSPIETPDGTGLSVTLEPEKIHRIESGVMVEGYTTTLMGPTISAGVLGPGANTTLHTFKKGVSRVTSGATRAWVLQQDVDHWDHQAPNDPPPPAPYAWSTAVDRASFATGKSVQLSPPIDTPVALGDDLFDVPANGWSDAARAMFVRLRKDDGSATTLHSGRGFGSAFCAGQDGLALAYQKESPSSDLEVVSVRRGNDGAWQAAEATIENTELDPTGIACDAAADRVALSVQVEPNGASHVYVLDVAQKQLMVDAPSLQGPLALASDGTAVVAMRVSDRSLTWASVNRTRATGLVLPSSPVSPQVVGDLALFELADALTVVHLNDGSPGPSVSLAPGDFAEPQSVTWPGGQAFVVAKLRYDNQNYDKQLDQLEVVNAHGVAWLPLPAFVVQPYLIEPAGSTLLVEAAATPDEKKFGFFRYDLGTRSLDARADLPLCDDQAVLGGRGCR